jgi:LysM repeat protein
VPTATPALTATAITGETATFTPTATGSVPVATQALPATPTYIVQQGDTLYSIAQRFATTVEALRAANGLANDNITAGQVLFITTSSPQPLLPGYIVHVVAPNDTLYSIAQRYGTTVEAIMQTNGLNSTRINIGQNLRIPVPISLAPLEIRSHI